MHAVTSGYYTLVEKALADLRDGVGPSEVVRTMEESLFRDERPLAEAFLRAVGLQRDTFLWRLMQDVVKWVHQETRSEAEEELVNILEEELGEKRAVVVDGVKALAYRGLVVSDGNKLTVPAVPYRLFGGADR